MSNLSTFCTCTNHKCKLHPRNHDKGCAPCIEKNLKTKELPSCYFNLFEDADKRKSDGFEAFCELVQNSKCKE